MSTQKLKAEICRPGILLQLHQAFPGRGSSLPPKMLAVPPEASLCHKHPEGAPSVLSWALGPAASGVCKGFDFAGN